jgi:hypothetical protein
MQAFNCALRYPGVFEPESQLYRVITIAETKKPPTGWAINCPKSF